MAQRIQLHLAARGDRSATVAGRLDALTDRLIGASALRGSGPVRAIGLVYSPNDVFPAGYPGMRAFDAMLELRDAAAEVAPLVEAVRGIGGEIDDLVQTDSSCAIAGEPRTIMPLVGGDPRPSRYMYMMRRKAGMTHAQYLDYYYHQHKRFGFRAPRHQGYVQLHVDPIADEEIFMDRTNSVAYVCDVVAVKSA